MLRTILVLALYAGGTVLGLQSVVWAGALLTWNDIFRPDAWARFWGPMAWLPIHYYCSGLLLFAVLFTSWKKRWNTMSGIIVVFLLLVWFSTVTAQVFPMAYRKAVDTTKYTLPILIMSMACVNRRFQHIYLYTLAFSVGIWLAWAGFHAVFVYGDIVPGMAIPGAQMSDRNDFLVAGLGCIPLLAYVGWTYEGRYRKWFRLGVKIMVVLSLAAYPMSHSRGGMVGLAGLALFFAFATGRIGKRLAIVGLLGFIGLPFVPESTWERLETIQLEGEQTEESAKNRTEHMRVAWKITLDHPLLGVGPLNAPVMSQRYGSTYTEPHSIWLKCSAEHGLTMLALFVGTIVWLQMALRRIALRARREKDPATERLAVALACSIVGFLAAGTFTSQFLSEYLWAIFALSGAFIASEKARYREEDDAVYRDRVRRQSAGGAAARPVSTHA